MHISDELRRVNKGGRGKYDSSFINWLRPGKKKQKQKTDESLRFKKKSVVQAKRRRPLCRRSGSTLTCIDTWQGGVQYHDIGLNLDGEKHTSDAVEARFDANIALVTGMAPAPAEEAEDAKDANAADNPVRKMKAGTSQSHTTRLCSNESRA